MNLSLTNLKLGADLTELKFAPSQYKIAREIENGSFENGTTDWGAGNGSSISVVTASPQHGGNAIRITAQSGGFNQKLCTKSSFLNTTKTYVCWGWARSDGNEIPKVLLGTAGPTWTGTASTDWQRFYVKGQATTGTLRLEFFESAGDGTQYVEFDDIYLVEL